MHVSISHSINIIPEIKSVEKYYRGYNIRTKCELNAKIGGSVKSLTYAYSADCIQFVGSFQILSEYFIRVKKPIQL